MVSDRVLDVYPHDQGQHRDEESRTGAVGVPGPRPGPDRVRFVDVEDLRDDA